MPIRTFLLSADGAELTINDDEVGTEQTCTSCGLVIARREPTGEISGSGGTRYLGSVKLAVVADPDGQLPGHISKAEGVFELCDVCGPSVLVPLGLLPAPDVDEHQGDELAEPADESQNPAMNGYKVQPVAILDENGRDSGRTEFERVAAGAVGELAAAADVGEHAAAAAE
jgi:hypothetical protein